MKKINIIHFEDDPDYIFSSDETNTVLIYPGEAEVDTGYRSDSGVYVFEREVVPCFYMRERMESGEIVEHRVFNWPIPETEEDYWDMIENADPYEIELC